MNFRNVTMFRFPATPVGEMFELLEKGAKDNTLKPVGPLAKESVGFISPFGRDSDVLIAQQGEFLAYTVGFNTKVIPGAAVEKLTDDEVDEQNRRYKQELADAVMRGEAALDDEPNTVGPKLRRAIKRRIIDELLPNALVRPSRVDVILDTRNGVVFVGTSSRKQAETAVKLARLAMGSFPAMPLNASESPSAWMTALLDGTHDPDFIAVGDYAVVADPVAEEKVTFEGSDLYGREMQRMLENGKRVARLMITIGDAVEMVLGVDLVFRKLALTFRKTAVIDRVEHEDARAEIDAMLALYSGELRGAFLLLRDELKIQDVEAQPKEEQPEQAAA